MYFLLRQNTNARDFLYYKQNLKFSLRSNYSSLAWISKIRKENVGCQYSNQPTHPTKGSGTPAFGRVGSLGGASPISSSSIEFLQSQVIFYLVFVPPAVAGVFRFSPPPLLFKPLLFPTACSLSRARCATNSDGSPVFSKSLSNSHGARDGRAAPDKFFINSEIFF